MALPSCNINSNVYNVCTEIYLQFPEFKRNWQTAVPTSNIPKSIQSWNSDIEIKINHSVFVEIYSKNFPRNNCIHDLNLRLRFL